jgi:hypothetical protein
MSDVDVSKPRAEAPAKTVQEYIDELDRGECRTVDLDVCAAKTRQVVVDRLRRNGERDVEDLRIVRRNLVGEIGVGGADANAALDSGLGTGAGAGGGRDDGLMMLVPGFRLRTGPRPWSWRVWRRGVEAV